MSTSTSFTSTHLPFQNFLPNFLSRKLLLQNPINQPPVTLAPPPNNYDHSFDGNVTIMLLSVLMCALICSLGLYSIIRCALKCATVAASESTSSSSARLANKGVKQKALQTFPIVNYSAETKLPGLDTECVICLAEFAPGERVRFLPQCNHGFHANCIDKWLKSHSSCPKCRHCLIETCQKILGCSQASTTEPSLPVQEGIVSIVPLEPEGLIRNYKDIN